MHTPTTSDLHKLYFSFSHMHAVVTWNSQSPYSIVSLLNISMFKKINYIYVIFIIWVHYAIGLCYFMYPLHKLHDVHKK